MYARPTGLRPLSTLWKRLASAFGALLLGGALASVPLAADAAEIGAGVTSIVMTTDDAIAQNMIVSFTGTWAVPNGSTPGDTFTMQLPPELAWQGRTTFELTNGSGEVVATAAVSDSGRVVFTLTDFVATHPNNVGGSFTFNARFTTEQTQSGPSSLTFHVGETAIVTPFTGSGPSTGYDSSSPDWTQPAKLMFWNSAQQQTTLSWLAANVGHADVNSVVILDHPALGLSLDCDSVTTATGQELDKYGNVLNAVDFSPAISCTPDELTVSWSGLPADINVLVTIVSNVVDDTLRAYTNDGLITIEGTNYPVSDTVKSLSASGSGSGSGIDTTPPTETIPPAEIISPDVTAPSTGPSTVETASIADVQQRGLSVDTGGHVAAGWVFTTFWLSVGTVALGLLLATYLTLRREPRSTD